jgi:hypothetical protein
MDLDASYGKTCRGTPDKNLARMKGLCYSCQNLAISLVIPPTSVTGTLCCLLDNILLNMLGLYDGRDSLERNKELQVNKAIDELY